MKFSKIESFHAGKLLSTPILVVNYNLLLILLVIYLMFTIKSLFIGGEEQINPFIPGDLLDKCRLDLSNF